jgi:hypothetical protein
MRYPHICPHCDHRSTRWWNLKIHIKRKHGGFLPGRSSGQFLAKTKTVQLGQGTVADTVGNTFQPRHLTQQAPLASSQYYTRPMPTMDIQKHGRFLPQETILKIQELKSLAYKYRQYQNNDPGVIVEWAVQGVSNGDDTFLDDKLKQLRIMDRRLNGRVIPFTVF